MEDECTCRIIVQNENMDTNVKLMGNGKRTNIVEKVYQNAVRTMLEWEYILVVQKKFYF